MKYFIYLLLAVSAFGQTTPNLHLNIPPQGTANYDVLLNNNFRMLDAATPNGFVAGSSTYATCDAAVAGLGANFGVVYIPGTYAGSNCTLPIPANVTVVDLRGGSTQMPARSDTFVNGDYIAYNSTVEGSLAGFAVQHGRTSPSTTSSAILATSKYTGVLPNSSTWAAITGENDIVGAVTPGTGTVTTFEAYTDVRSTGGTVAEADGFLGSVNIGLASATTNITRAASVRGNTVTNTSASGAAIAEAYGGVFEKQTVGTSRNYSIYSVGQSRFGYTAAIGVRLDAENSSGIPQAFLGTDSNDTAYVRAVSSNGVSLRDSTGVTQQKIASTGTTFSTCMGADGSGFKHLRGTTGCTTGASVGAACTTIITWTTTFADANYTATCTGDLITSGVPVSGGLTAKSASAVTFQTVATTASAAKFTAIDCVGVHD